MAKFNDKMRGSINASLNGRAAPPGSGGAPRPVGSADPAFVKREGRKALGDAAALIRLDRIIGDPDQPRKEFDPIKLEMLAGSLKARGQLQPIRVRYVPEIDRYIVIAGERRFRAAILAGLESIACVEAPSASPEDILEDQLVENALRSDLQPVEQARAFERLMKARNLSQRQLADRLQISNGAVGMALAMLGNPETILAKVEAGSITPSMAYELSKVADPGEQAELAELAEAKLVTRDGLKELVRKPRAGRTAKPAPWTSKPPEGGSVVVAHPEGLDGGRLVAMLRQALAEAEAGR